MLFAASGTRFFGFEREVCVGGLIVWSMTLASCMGMLFCSAYFLTFVWNINSVQSLLVTR